MIIKVEKNPNVIAVLVGKDGRYKSTLMNYVRSHCDKEVTAK